MFVNPYTPYHAIAWYGVYGFTNIFPDDYGLRVLVNPDTALDT